MPTKLEKQAKQLWQHYEGEGPLFWKQYDQMIDEAKKQAAVLPKPVFTPLSMELVPDFQEVYSRLGDEAMGVWIDTRTLGNDLLNLKLILGTLMLCAICTGQLGVIFVTGLFSGLGLVVGNLIRSITNTVKGRKRHLLKIKFEVDGLKITKRGETRKVLYRQIQDFSQKGLHHFRLKVRRSAGSPEQVWFSVKNKKGAILEDPDKVNAFLETVVLLNERN